LYRKADKDAICNNWQKAGVDLRSIRCKRCKQMFEFEGFEGGQPPKRCPRCKDIEMQQYSMVRELVRDNPGITALEVSAYTEVSLPTILGFLKDGRLEIWSGSAQDRDLIAMPINRSSLDRAKAIEEPPEPEKVVEEIPEEAIEEQEERERPKQKGIRFLYEEDRQERKK